ncbi:uncharacterized protein LOC116303313 [Actinia tenebrosa]|uniref:Uncharacterized protein LOC116303313 n=1 Tax=Actinia tenebrosa TaxID=6105 RepID=A0A6P8IQZ6_ACTTE|nr:uncharacterized protein LOC116303313 [Actinia tenebrosa]
MKALIIALAVVVAVYGEPMEKRFLIDRCSSSSECGANKCCLFNKVCSPQLPKYSTCHLTSVTSCGCADGLECRVTKEFSVLGQKIQLRQCMETGLESRVEKLENEEEEEPGKRERRFLVDKCTAEADCGANKCCLLNKVCAPKLTEGSTCFLSQHHKCGCADGLECRVTTTITIPLLGTKIPIRQCVKPE